MLVVGVVFVVLGFLWVIYEVFVLLDVFVYVDDFGLVCELVVFFIGMNESFYWCYFVW